MQSRKQFLSLFLEMIQFLYVSVSFCARNFILNVLNVRLGVSHPNQAPRFSPANAYILIFRHYKLEAELASMNWKINPEDLLPMSSAAGGARGEFGSRRSLARGVSFCTVLVLSTSMFCSCEQ